MELELIYNDSYTIDEGPLHLSIESGFSSFINNLVIGTSNYNVNIHGTRGNIFRSLIFTTFWFFIVYLLFLILNVIAKKYFSGPLITSRDFSFKEILLAYVTSLSVFFWNFRTNYSDRWEYCAGLYNKAMEIKCGPADDNNKIARIMLVESSLVMDVLEMSIWNDPAFDWMVQRYIYMAYRYGNKDKNQAMKEFKEAWSAKLSSMEMRLKISVMQNDLDKYLSNL